MTNEDVCKAAESYEDGLIYSSKLSKRVPIGVLILHGMTQQKSLKRKDIYLLGLNALVLLHGMLMLNQQNGIKYVKITKLLNGPI